MTINKAPEKYVITSLTEKDKPLNEKRLKSFLTRITLSNLVTSYRG